MLRLFWGAHPSRLLRTRRPLRLRTRRVRFRARTCALRPPTARLCGSRTPSRRMARGCRRPTAQPSRCPVGSASRSRLGPCSCWVSAGCRLVDNSLTASGFHPQQCDPCRGVFQYLGPCRRCDFSRPSWILHQTAHQHTRRILWHRLKSE